MSQVRQWIIQKVICEFNENRIECALGNDGAKTFAEFLKKNTTLTSLNLRGEEEQRRDKIKEGEKKNG